MQRLRFSSWQQNFLSLPKIEYFMEFMKNHEKSRAAEIQGNVLWEVSPSALEAIAQRITDTCRKHQAHLAFLKVCLSLHVFWGTSLSNIFQTLLITSGTIHSSKWLLFPIKIHVFLKKFLLIMPTAYIDSLLVHVLRFLTIEHISFIKHLTWIVLLYLLKIQGSELPFKRKTVTVPRL